MKKNVKKLIITLVIVVLVLAAIWFIFLAPYITFKKNENTMLNAAKRYYELNPTKMPTGTRMATVTLKDLYKENYIKDDFYLPHSTEPCSITNSWVKVKQVDGEYKYYTYLDCGIIKSSVDHEGPKIVLNGKEEITINRNDKYEEPGVKSVTDNTDGTMDIKNVVIDSSKVDTSQVGTYTVTYTATDSFKNKTTVKRVVKVVQKLNKTVKDESTENGIYKGIVLNNYISFSGMLFRIIGLDGNNVKIVSENDIASVNYKGIESWLDYFYEHLADSSKDFIVENTYCTGTVPADNINSTTECAAKTKKKKVYLLSNKELNESRDASSDSYLFSETINWTSITVSDENAWSTKYGFVPLESSTQFYGFSKDYNFAIRPVLTIKGDSLIIGGQGTEEVPYLLGDIDTGKANEYINTRYSGEYITYSGSLWRIIESTKDGYTKVIAEKPFELIDNSLIKYETEDEIKIYNPNQKGNIGYIINRRAGEATNEEYFVTREISVPIYKDAASYKGEVETKKYKVKFAAPDMYEMFSAPQVNSGMGYWLINSSKTEFRKYVYSNIGIVMYDDELSNDYETYIRPTAYFDKSIKIVSGSGTKEDPYKISK